MKAWQPEPNPNTADGLKSRALLISLCFCIILLILFVRLWNLQMLQGPELNVLSENNRIALRLVRSPRGLLFASGGELLVDNRRASFDVYIIQDSVRDLERTTRMLAHVTEQPYAELYEKIRRANPFRPFLVKADVRHETMAVLEEHKPDYPGVFVRATALRQYHMEEQAGHLLGYLGEVNDAQLRRLKKKDYRLGDLIGQHGIERAQERFLRGQSGFKRVEVDAYGRELRTVRTFAEKPGNNAWLTIDMDLQKKAGELFKDHEGSIIALDPADGAILAMVSKPSFNPNAFAAGIAAEDWKALTEDPLKPLENRATRGQYPPGSIFKIVMSFAALDKKTLNPNDRIFCNGTFQFGNRLFRDWKEGGHGHVNHTQALAQSCDVYYYTLGARLGIKNIAHYSRMFGLGASTGFGVAEKGGLVPSDAWKRRRFGERWYEGETISVAIGQGFNLITPMQAASLIATVANGGNLWRPYVVKKVASPDGRTLFEAKPRLIRKIPISPEIFKRVREGLREVVNGGRGTARRARVPGVIVAGKTGTAQTVALKHTGRKRRPEELPRKHRDHGWFIAFAPYEKPVIAVAILGEHAGRPGSFFAPYARELISVYLKKNRLQAAGERR